MRNLIHQSPFLSTYFLPEENILKLVFSHKTTEMSPADFRQEMHLWCEQLETYHTPGNIVDTRKFGFAISPELQQWYNAEINPRSYAAGLRKMAFIVPENVVSEFSIEQIFSEQSLIIFNFFQNLHQAQSWLSWK